jgi:hypothetical protein
MVTQAAKHQGHFLSSSGTHGNNTNQPGSVKQRITYHLVLRTFKNYMIAINEVYFLSLGFIYK